MITQQQIEVFRAVLSEGTISAAGRRLNLSQPSVSRVLSELETHVGFRLFLRRARGMAPTAEAEFFQRVVDTTYSALQNLEIAAWEIAQRRRGHLSLVVNYALSLDLAPRSLAQMRLEERNVSVSFQCKSSDWIIDFARSGMIRTGIANIERMPAGMSTRLTSATPHLVLLSPADPLARSGYPIEIEKLKSRRVVSLTGSVADRMELILPGLTMVQAETSLSAVTLAERIGAIPIVDAFTAEFWTARTNLVARSVTDLPDYMLALFSPSGAQLSALDEELQDTLGREIRKTEAWVASGLKW